MSQIVIGTAGHIDHGKTTLVNSLTGINTDYLPEEKIRGMTIDLGFAYLNDSITLIDVPGHEKFIRNMVAGAANIHFGLIVIAADDGIMPQTKEHLEILTLLGVEKGWVAITKTGKVEEEEWIDLIESEILDFTLRVGFKPLSIRRVDNISQTGIDDLKKDILSVEQDSFKSFNNIFRMNIDRVFSKIGFGTIVTGTVINGKISVGDNVEVKPLSSIVKIRGIQSHGGNVNKVFVGDRAAINISNIKTSNLKRGYSLVTPNTIKNSKIIFANITMLQSTKWEIRNNQRLRFYIGTSETLGRINLCGAKKLRKGETTNTIIRFESYVSVAMDDKFVIRSYSPMETIGGGIILNPNPKWPKNQLYKNCLKVPFEIEDRLSYFIDCYWDNPKSIDFWNLTFFNSDFDVGYHLSLKKSFILKDKTVFTKTNKHKSIDILKNYFKEYYMKNPPRKMIALESIRNELGWSTEWLKIIAKELVKTKLFEFNKGKIGMVKYTGNHDSNMIANIKQSLSNTDILVLTTRQIIEISGMQPKQVKESLYYLIEGGEIISIGNENYLMKEKYIYILDVLKIYFKSNRKLSIPDFKNLFSLTRKTAIPLLEFLDKEKFTDRDCDFRLKGIMLK